MKVLLAVPLTKTLIVREMSVDASTSPNSSLLHLERSVDTREYSELISKRIIDEDILLLYILEIHGIGRGYFGLFPSKCRYMSFPRIFWEGSTKRFLFSTSQPSLKDIERTSSPREIS